MRNILIGGAWPYANGPLHIGHIAGLLNGDILARYHRLKGDKVLYVSGSDCYGTPIALKARQERLSPEAIALRYHKELVKGFDALNFSYDQYGTTTETIHRHNAQDFFTQLDSNGYVEEQTVQQHYCPGCQQFLADRYIIAPCPHCGAVVRGEECDNCSNPIDLLTLKDTTCSVCSTPTERRPNTNLYFRLSELNSDIASLLDTRRSEWRKNAVKLTERYLKEGLRDRAYSRDLDWGIPVPREDYSDKTIYIWLENVLGYSSMVHKWCQAHNENPYDYLKASDNLKTYYIHAKDNIPFHTIILPALLLAADKDYALPHNIVSNEYLTLEGSKISTSSGWAIWVNDLIERYDADSIRHYLTINSPEKKDSNFTYEDFIYTHNSDLVGQLGNLVNRTLSFINKYYGGRICTPTGFGHSNAQIEQIYEESSQLLESGQVKDAYRLIFSLVKEGNHLFDKEQPWKTRTSEPSACITTLYKVSHLILNIANLLLPFIPVTAKKIFDLYQCAPSNNWSIYTTGDTITPTTDLSILFDRIPIEQIAEEREALTRICQPD